MNFLQLTQRLHSEMLRSTAAPTSVSGASDRNARLFNAIADAWKDLQSERDWRWMRQTTNDPLTAGVQTYPASALNCVNFGRWRPEDRDYSPYCFIPTNPTAPFKLDYWQLDQFRYHFVYRPVGQTVPIAWTWDETNQLLVGPKPADNYLIRIEYWQEPVDLVADNDTPGMPSRFHMLLVWDALLMVGASEVAPELMQRAQAERKRLRFDLLLDQARLPHM